MCEQPLLPKLPLAQMRQLLLPRLWLRLRLRRRLRHHSELDLQRPRRAVREDDVDELRLRAVLHSVRPHAQRPEDPDVLHQRRVVNSLRQAQRASDNRASSACRAASRVAVGRVRT